MIVTGIGIITGHWQNDITAKEYLQHNKYMDSYGHPTGTAAVKEFNKEAASRILENNKINKEQEKHSIK